MKQQKQYNMKRIILLTLFALMTSALFAQNQDEPDTLLNAKNAKELIFSSMPGGVEITVNGIDSTSNNFHYNYFANNNGKINDGDTEYFRSTKVKDILIVTADSVLSVNYRDEAGNAEYRNVVLRNTPDRQVRTWTGSGSFGLKFARSGNTSWEIVTSGISFGFVTPTGEPKGMGIDMGRSLEWSWNVIMGVEMTHGRHRFLTGLGVRFKSLVSNSNHYFFKNDDKSITTVPFDDDTRDHKSGFYTFALQVPVLYKLDMGRSWLFSVGPIVNFNTGAHITSEYKAGDVKHKFTTSKIGQRPVTVDGYASMTFHGIGLYVRYSPMKMLRDRANLDFGTFSTGVVVAF